jgi:hypothetical protein
MTEIDWITRLANAYETTAGFATRETVSHLLAVFHFEARELGERLLYQGPDTPNV